LESIRKLTYTSEVQKPVTEFELVHNDDNVDDLVAAAADSGVVDSMSGIIIMMGREQDTTSVPLRDDDYIDWDLLGQEIGQRVEQQVEQQKLPDTNKATSKDAIDARLESSEYFTSIMIAVY
jgi:hypothetical protein